MTKCTTSQRKSLYRLFGYCKDTEAIHVKALTKDLFSRANDLSIQQADTLLKSLSTNWAVFDKENQKHKYILSLLMQLGWSKAHDKYGTVADLSRLSNFLKSKNSPLYPNLKPLQDMDVKKELPKLIVCLESILHKNNKNGNL